MDFQMLELPAVLLGVLLIFCVVIVVYGMAPWRVACRREESSEVESLEFRVESSEEENLEEGDAEESEESVEAEIEKPFLSVIVYSDGNSEVLTRMIDSLRSQTFRDMEIIVVDDATAAATAMLAEKFEGVKNLYFTFIPPGSQVLSRRKLALMIGIKAAKGEVVLTTQANALVASDRWLEEMMRPYMENPAVEIVMGTAHPDYSEFSAMKRRGVRRRYLSATVMWVAAALSGRPFRGNGFNLSFRRRLFFDNKGYSRMMLLEGGDDDIFISAVANAENTAVALHPATVLTMEWGGSAQRVMRNLTARYRATRKYLPRAPFRRRAVCRWLNWLLIPAGLAAVATGWLLGAWITPAIVALLLIVLTYIYEYLMFRKGEYKYNR